MLDWKTLGYSASLFLILCLSAYLLGGNEGVVMVLAASAGAMALIPHVSPYRIARLKGAWAVDPTEAPDLYRLVINIVQKTDLHHLPQIMVFPSQLLNAYAIGTREQSVIALSTKCLQTLPRDEICAIIAHEIGHIVNGDARLLVFSEVGRLATATVALFATVLISIIALNGNAALIPAWIIIYFGATPWLALWLQSQLSKHRELLADAFAAHVLGSVRPMLKVLQRLNGEQHWARYWGLIRLPSGLEKWFSTHPSLEMRFKALRHNAPKVVANRYYPQIPIRYL